MLKISRNELLKSLNLVIGTCGQEKPIYQNILFSLKENKLSITASDSELEAQISIDIIEKFANFSITLPAKKLYSVVKNLEDNTSIIFNKISDQDKIELTCQRNKYLFASLPAENFPKIEKIIKGRQYSLKKYDLMKLFRATMFSIANQDVRYYLNGLYLEIYEDNITAVTTDGHRLSISTKKLNFFEKHKVSLIVPKKTVHELIKVLTQKEGEEIELYLEENYFKLELDNFSYISKIIDGKFPDYKKVIPNNNNRELIIDRIPLLTSLQRVSILSNHKIRGSIFNITKESLTLTTTNSINESAKEYIDCEFKGDDIEISFNINYIMDVLNLLKSEKVVFKITDTNSSISLTEYNDDVMIESQYIIMPMRI